MTEWLATLSYALYLTHEASVHVTQSALADIGFARIRWVIDEATS